MGLIFNFLHTTRVLKVNMTGHYRFYIIYSRQIKLSSFVNILSAARLIIFARFQVVSGADEKARLLECQAHSIGRYFIPSHHYLLCQFLTGPNPHSVGLVN